jgi:hypothetical protein
VSLVRSVIVGRADFGSQRELVAIGFCRETR